MIYLPEYPLNPTRFPLDNCAIINKDLKLKQDVGDCPPDKLDSLPPDLRDHVHHKRCDAKKNLCNTKNPNSREKYNPTIPTCTIWVADFNGIKLHAEKKPGIGWVIYMITFNPSRVSRGHNGAVIEQEHFIHSCSDLIELVAPLLADPNDAIHLIPGLSPGSRSWWRSLEIPFQVPDPGGLIMKAFTHAKHTEINVEPAYQYANESIAFSNSVGDLLIRVYRKDLEMKKKHKRMVTSDNHVLRIEVNLSGSKLEQHCKGGKWADIDGTRRLVSFKPADLRAAFLSVISGFLGVFSKPPSVVGQNDEKIGRMMGWVSSMTKLSVNDQIAYYNMRFHDSCSTGTIRNSKSKLRKAAHKELALLSKVSLSDLFDEKAWHYQPAVVCAGLEGMREARHMEVTNHPLVEAVYGSPIQRSYVGSIHSQSQPHINS